MKARNACTNCDLLPTKLDGGRDHKAITALVENAVEIEVEKTAGYPRCKAMMTALEFRAFLLLDELISIQDRRIGVENNLCHKAQAGWKEA